MVRDAVDGARMAVGTLTAIPVRVVRVDRVVAGWAMALAPLVAVLLGGLCAVVLAAALTVGLDPLLASVLAVGALAVLTRGLHLDGLADVADGLGSGRPPEGALAVMRRSDIGPFGVVALVMTVLVQVLALASVVESGALTAALALGTGLLSGRLTITWACVRGVPAARSEGLGSFVAGSVAPWAATLVSAAVVAGCLLARPGFVPALLLGLVAAAVLLCHTRRRLGGITGDVLGALTETATTTALLVTAASLS
nr:adenosylcobinamide-GDP ribazoletransferase [Nocardiopsis ansamitocini]